MRYKLGPSVFFYFLIPSRPIPIPILTLELPPSFAGTIAAQGPPPCTWLSSHRRRAAPPRAGSKPMSAQGRPQGRLQPTACSLQPATGAQRAVGSNRHQEPASRQEQDELPPSTGCITTRAGDLIPSSSSDPARFQK
jgi:hypothetical protein